MIIADRIMQGDVTARYNPNLAEVEGSVPISGMDRTIPTGQRQEPQIDGDVPDDDVPATERQEHLRLQKALQDYINRN